MIVQLVAGIELLLILAGITNFTGAKMAASKVAETAWLAIDVITIAFSALLAYLLWGATDPYQGGLAWVLAIGALGITVLQLNGNRVTGSVWKYMDGLNIGALLVAVLAGVHDI